MGAEGPRRGARGSAARGEAPSDSGAIPGVPGRVGCCLQDTRPSTGILTEPSPRTGSACNPDTGRQGSGAEEQIPNQDGAIKSPKCFSVPTIKLCYWGTARRYLPSLSPEGGVTLHCSPVLPTDMEGTPP